MALSQEVKVLAGVMGLTILVVVVGAYLAGRNNDSGTTAVNQPERLVRADDPVVGASDAKVTIVEFGDFQCPACGALHPIFAQLKEANKDKSVRFAYRHFPLEQHEHAQLAAEAAVEAQAQGKFWEFHDVLFANQTRLDRAALEQHASTVGLNIDQFKQALDTNKHRGAVLDDRVDGQALRVSATPTIFINGVLYTQQFSVSQLQAVIDQALNS